MPNPVRPTPGNYRVTKTSPSPTTTAIYPITMLGFTIPGFGTLPWVQDGEGDGNGHYEKDPLAITFYSDGTFAASWGSDPSTGTWAPA